MKTNLYLASGIVSKLTVSDERKNLVSTDGLKGAAKGLGVMAAVAGMAAEAAQVSAVGDTDEKLDVYQFELNGERFCGYTRLAEFKNGDFVNVVYQRNETEHNALAVCRPSTRNIWVQHFMTKGTYAGILHAIKLWMGISLAFATVFFAIIFLNEFISGGWIKAVEFIQSKALYFFPATSAMLLIPAPFMAPRFFEHSKLATEVFKIFGFNQPHWVDLERTSKPKRLTPQQLNEKCKAMHHHDAFVEYKKNSFRYWY